MKMIELRIVENELGMRPDIQYPDETMEELLKNGVRK